MSTTTPLAVDLRNAEKTYRGGIRALRGVSLQIRKGEVFGLLGPNGAGKSTLVKIMLTIIRANRCEGAMLGRPVGHKPTLARVGYLPEHHKFPEYLTGRQVLEYFAALSNVDPIDSAVRADKLLDLVGMTEWQHQKVRKYSKGMRQRIGVAQALMMNPDLIVLDEPTDGVDPVGRRDIRNILMEQRRLGKAVLVNSHLLSELELVCDRVAIMVNGSITSQGTLDELTAYDRRYELTVPMDDAPERVQMKLIRTIHESLAGKIAAASDAPRADRFEIILGDSRVPIVVDENRVLIDTRDSALAQPVIDAVRGAGIVITSFRDIRPSLEDLFVKAVEQTGSNGHAGARPDPKGASTP